MKWGEIINRLEPKFYLSKYLNNEIKIQKSPFDKAFLYKITKLISDGTHFTPNYVENGVKFLSVKDVRPFEIDYENSKFISVNEAKKLDRRCKPELDDVLLTKIGATFGFAATIKKQERFQIFVSVALLRVKSNIVLPDFLTICLNSQLIYTQFDRVIKGAGVPDLHLEDIKKIEIPLPSLNIQAKIIEKFNLAYATKKQKETQAQKLLDSIDDYLLSELGIELPEEQPNTLGNRVFLRNYGELMGGRFDPRYYTREKTEFFKKLLSLKFEKLKHFIKDGSYGILPPSDSYDKSNPIMLLRATELKEGLEIDFSNLCKVPLEYYERRHNAKLCKNDILIAVKGATIASKKCITFVKNDVKNIIVNGTIFRFQAQTKHNPLFLACILNSKIVKKQMKYNLTANNAVDYLDKNLIENLLIPNFSLKKQTQIANHITKIRNQAKQLRTEAQTQFQQTKQQVEAMILGETL
ncbi:restriction endonuclease subunit S [Candidatus Halobeggiatoa sp. HSG11]|nr:restriction endonuclease subunit S [Candidatus Halobeggiatoa sp. HSG11]